MKKTFSFYQDVKVSIWQRQRFDIEAENEEEARFMALKYRDNDVAAHIPVTPEWLYDSEELMTPDECGGMNTIQLYLDSDEYPFATNATRRWQQMSGEFEHYATARDKAIWERKGIAIEFVDGWGMDCYEAYHRDGNLHVLVLKGNDEAVSYCFATGIADLMTDNACFRSTMESYLKEHHGDNCRPWPEKEGLTDRQFFVFIPFSLKELIEVWGSHAAVHHYLPGKLQGVRVKSSDGASPKDRSCAGILLNHPSSLALSVLERVRTAEPGKDWSLHPVYAG